jgi:hypothetical protein
MRSRFGVALVGAILVIAGCSSSGPRYLPVRGILRVDGLPAEGATLMFIPPEGGHYNGGIARTTAEGQFELVGSHGRGLEAGEYKVMVRWFVRPDGSPLPPGTNPEKVECKQVIPHPYNDRETTTLTTIIQKDGPPIELDISTKKK